MSRPLSATESNAGTHGGAATRPATKTRDGGPSKISLFLANLRLLNLDLRDDYPDITLKTFDLKDAAHSQKRRIACTEWTLFRLFELWDSRTTKDKLKPFFPPLEPLQSINLRAALFRCLNDLKKNGELGREVVLRKTMLDECKGDKLEELLVVFSAIVVRKHVIAQACGRMLPLAQKLATQPLSDTEAHHTVQPLLLVHRVALSHAMQRREQEAARLHVMSLGIERMTEGVRVRCAQAHLRLASTPSGVPTAIAEDIRQQVHQAWPDAGIESSILLANPVATSTLPDFQDFGIQASGVAPNATSETEPTIMANIEWKLRALNDRKRNLKYYQGKLGQAKKHLANHTQANDRKEATPVVKFSSHRNLRPQAAESIQSGVSHNDEAKVYEPILEDMHQALAQVARPPPATSSGGLIRSHAERDDSGANRSGHEFMALTTGPNEQLEREMALKPGSMDADFFSPVKKDIVSPMYEEHSSEEDTVPTIPTEPSDADAELQVNRHVHDEDAEQDAEQEDPASQSSHTPVPAPPSKAELGIFSGPPTTYRIGFNSSSPDLRASASPTPLPSMPSFPNSTTSTSHMVRMSLADETRQSIADSLARTASTRATKHFNQNLQSRGSLYPVNQFETPRKHAHEVPLSTVDDLGIEDGLAKLDIEGEETTETTVTPKRVMTMGRRDITPISKLFSEDAEYASVFKSRPKIKTSPVASTPGDL